MPQRSRPDHATPAAGVGLPVFIPAGERKMAPRRICAGEATVSCKSMTAVRGSIGFADLPFFRGPITPEAVISKVKNQPSSLH